MIKKLLALTCLTLSISGNAAVIEVGDLNIIDDAGNASDGLRFLDMTYSDGLTEAAALTSAQGAYANARLATASEWNDLFVAANIGYNSTLVASDAFTVGETAVISSTTNYDAGVLSGKLGYTNVNGDATYMWSDPDGTGDLTSSRDYMRLTVNEANIYNQNNIPASHSFGWLIVSEVPIPAAAWLFGSALLGLGALKRRKA